MKLPKFELKNNQAFKGGSYSLMITAVVLAIIIVVNVFVAALPTTATKYDMSSSKLYSITSNTKAVVNGLSDDVTIYWIVQSGEEDEVMENILGKYESLSSHIEVVKKNPDVYPTFAENYTDEDVANNSLVVECGDRYRYIAYSDIYQQELDTTTYSYTTSFDGEGAITSAIDYVVNAEQPKMYILEGHGESELPDNFTNQITKENIETESLSLVKNGSVPEDADAVFIYAPSSDISEEEAAILKEYVSNGGKLMVIAGPAEDDELANLYSVLENYGVTANTGIVVEGDSEHYSFNYPYILLPDVSSSDITDSLIEEGYNPIMPIATGLTISESSENGTVTELLTTSDEAYSKKDGYAITTYEKEDGDTDGPFALAVSITDNSDGQIIWFASSAFLEDTYNSYSSGANIDLAMNGISSLIGENETLAIRSKSLNYNYLTISDSTSSMLKFLMIGAFPLVYLGIGIMVVVRRRGLERAAN